MVVWVQRNFVGSGDNRGAQLIDKRWERSLLNWQRREKWERDEIIGKRLIIHLTLNSKLTCLVKIVITAQCLPQYLSLFIYILWCSGAYYLRVGTRRRIVGHLYIILSFLIISTNVKRCVVTVCTSWYLILYTYLYNKTVIFWDSNAFFLITNNKDFSFKRRTTVLA